MQNKKSEIDFFNKFRKDGYDVFDEKGYEKIIQLFNKLIRPEKGEKVVEFGCGTGSFTKYLRKYKLDITGIDISAKCIKYAKRNYLDTNFLVADIENTGLSDNRFDIAFLGGVLHHLDNLFKCAKEVYRVVKPSGRFFAYDPHKKNPIMWLYRDKKSPLYSNVGVTPNERLLTAEEIKQAFTNAGFKEIIVFPTSGITYKYVESKITKNFLPLYNLAETIFDRTYFSKKYGSFLISFGKKNEDNFGKSTAS